MVTYRCKPAQNGENPEKDNPVGKIYNIKGEEKWIKIILTCHR
jgi:hypothetical protein